MQAVKKQRREVTDVTLSEIITCLETKDHPIHKLVPKSTALISALRELDALVEMQTAKTALIRLLAQMLLQKKPKKPQMNHCCIYGPPGVGKTKLGVILARIWTGLGILKPQVKPVVNHTECQHKINQAEQKMEAYQRGLRTANTIAEKQQASLAEIRYELRQLHREREKCLTGKRRQNDYFLEGLDVILELHRDIRFQADDLVYLTETPKLPPIPLEPELPIKIVGRQDFVAGYVGQTAIKTEALLKDSVGKVVFIDEAYSLCQDDRDWFGLEALTVINRWMSEQPDAIIFIFAGYKDLLQKSIFRAQPGLERRCTWVIDVEGYQEEGLQHIFEQQMKAAEYTLDAKICLKDFFRENKAVFKAYGGDTERLMQQCELIYAQTKLHQLVKGEKVTYEPIITQPILQKALEAIQKNSVAPKESDAYQTMFA